MLVPSGTSLDSFVVLPEREALKEEPWSNADEIVSHVLDSHSITRYIFEALGLSLDLLDPQTSTNLFLRYYKVTKVSDI